MSGALSEPTPGEVRAAIRRVPATRAIVTAPTGEGHTALLVDTFTSASVDPPLVLVCIPRSAPGFAAFQSAVAFGVSILGEGHPELGEQFVNGGDLGQARGWTIGPATGAPLWDAAVLRIECATYDRHAAGDSIILVGEVLSLSELESVP